ncbi:MAG: peptidoglycan-binding protein [Candidatus Pacebacteria bacterium]|nr:peptidoglycan-binding protein [Candidatus Paceibacterota bacterium]
MNTKSLVAGIIISVALATPFAASALSIGDLQQQIKDLLAKIATLQAEIRMQSTASTSPVSNWSEVKSNRICSIINRNLVRGQSGDDVKGLQEFLSTEGYLQASATGFFGPATAQALAKWQSKNNISAIGSFGPLSRERIKIWCGNSGNGLLSVSPNKGAAPLTVTVTSKTGDASDYRPSMADGRDTMIDFGDGTERQWVHCATNGQDIYPSRCQTPVSFSHTYTADDVYIVSIVKSGGMCLNGCKDETIATEKVIVGNSPVACTKEYMPVCGAKQVVCVAAPCNPVPTTYGNVCTMKADGATLLYSGACKDTTVSPENDSMCKSWNDGCNSCGRSTPGGPAFCTLKYCSPESMQKPYCSAYFDNGSNSNKAPVISSFSGPVLLAVNEIGTWKITATDPENGTLKYSIVWGDEWTASEAAMRTMAPQASIQQDSSFTHSYATAGNYTVGLTVTDSEGKEARSTATVQVSQTACTGQYQPVCGRPNGCANTCAPGMYCALMCQMHEPQTYSNRCQMNNSNATLMHEGVCTGNEGYLQ